MGYTQRKDLGKVDGWRKKFRERRQLRSEDGMLRFASILYEWFRTRDIFAGYYVIHQEQVQCPRSEVFSSELTTAQQLFSRGHCHPRRNQSLIELFRYASIRMR